MKTYYEILKVNKDAEIEVIAAAYKALAKKYHPDANANSAYASEAMKEINVAYDVLSDPNKRRVYDASLKNTTSSSQNTSNSKYDNARYHKGRESENSRSGYNNQEEKGNGRDAGYNDYPIEKLLENAFSCLNRNEWHMAEDLFKLVNEKKPYSGESYAGIFMVRKKISSVDGIYDYYTSMFRNFSEVSLVACDEDTNRIQAVCSSRPQTIESKMIWDMYDFDRTYISYITSMKKKKNEIELSINNEEFIRKSLEYSSGDFSVQLRGVISKISDYLSCEINKAQSDDEMHKRAVEDKYKQFLIDTDEKVKKLYGEEFAKIEDEYVRLCNQFNTKGAPLKSLLQGFEKISGYKDAVLYIKKCRAKKARIAWSVIFLVLNIVFMLVAYNYFSYTYSKLKIAKEELGNITDEVDRLMQTNNCEKEKVQEKEHQLLMRVSKYENIYAPGHNAYEILPILTINKYCSTFFSPINFFSVKVGEVIKSELYSYTGGILLVEENCSGVEFSWLDEENDSGIIFFSFVCNQEGWHFLRLSDELGEVYYIVVFAEDMTDENN